MWTTARQKSQVPLRARIARCGVWIELRLSVVVLFMKSSAVCTPLVHTYIPGHTSFFSLRFVDSTERCLPGGAKLKSLLNLVVVVDLVVVVLASRSSTPFLCGVCASSTKGTARHKSLRSNSRYASATLASVVQSPPPPPPPRLGLGLGLRCCCWSRRWWWRGGRGVLVVTST